MEKRLIGSKVELSATKIILGIVGGGVVAIGGIMFYIFVLRGAIGGGIAGGLVAVGGYAIFTFVRLKTLPDQLVFIDDKAVYFPNNTIYISQISSADVRGKTIIIMLENGKKYSHPFISNIEDCRQEIVNALIAHKSTTPPQSPSIDQ